MENLEEYNALKEQISKKLKLSNLEDSKNFLELEITRDS